MADVKQVKGAGDVDNLVAGLGLLARRELCDLVRRLQKL